MKIFTQLFTATLLLITLNSFGYTMQNGCQSGTVTITTAIGGTGTWTAHGGNAGPSTITSPTSVTTTVSGFTTPGVYAYIWTSSSGIDTAIIQVSARPVIHGGIVISGGGSQACVGQCVWWNDTSTTACGTLVYAIDWGQGTLDTTPLVCHRYTSAGTFHVIATLANTCGCLAADTVVLVVNNCAPDTVWPGDADRSMVVDNNDLLPIGLAYGTTGAARASVSNAWLGDIATPWAQTFTIYAPGVNYDNADCNGDGTIDAADTVAISLNFGDIHSKTSGPGTWRSGTPALRVGFSVDTVLDGQTLTSTISLGDAAIPVSNIYGLAFTFNYDPTVVDTNTLSFSFLSSWLGTNSNSIHIAKNFIGTGEVKAAITGIDHIARSGSGQIATFIAVVTTGNLNGKNLSYYANRNYISNVTAIDASGHPIQLNAGSDSNYVGYYPSGIREVNTASAHVYPNPAANSIIITADAEMNEITITDMLGQNAKTIKVAGKSATINIAELASGIYTIHASTLSGTATSKLVVSR